MKINLTHIGNQMSKELVTTPSYINTDSNRGNDAVSMTDIEIPRLEIVQSLSPCREKGNVDYIEGAEEGLHYNTVTRELYGDSVIVCPVHYLPQFLIWKDRKLGGGFRGAFNTAQEANRRRAQLAAEDGLAESSFTIAETHTNYALLVGADGSASEIVLSFSRSKLKVSRKWNSVIRMNGGDRFSRVYQLKSVVEKNAQNQSYYNWSIATAGYPSEEVYHRAENLYNVIGEGRASVDYSDVMGSEASDEI